MIHKPIHKLLVANRGEIACRILGSAKSLGLKTVAVYSEADRHSLAVEMADEAVCIGKPHPKESYLDADKILKAAVKLKVDAIHPGYGFLSENARFAKLCAESGIVFIGPPPEAIRLMGEKDSAKQIMRTHQVPIIPGYDGEVQDDDHLLKEADKVGYPLLIKAVSGGGGRGIRRLEDRRHFLSELELARSESQRAFGDNRVILEKFITEAKHIEFQIFMDRFGNGVYLFERDCSLQRKYQKVLEEAPSQMPPEMRRLMGETAIKAARAVGYVGAGTVEYVVDVSTGYQKDKYYFLEMNTRLQVEHPITEAITGVDLVEWQIKVAAGEALPKEQKDLSIKGHAIEFRIYAEDSENNFMPSMGEISHFVPPTGVRVDTGVRAGDKITPYYDAMIAKMIVHADNRQQALAQSKTALSDWQVSGIKTNIGFLSKVIDYPAVIDNQVTTRTMSAFELYLSDSIEKAKTQDNELFYALVFAAVYAYQQQQKGKSNADLIHLHQPESENQGDLIEFEYGSKKHALRVKRVKGNKQQSQYQFHHNNKLRQVEEKDPNTKSDEHKLQLMIDGDTVDATVKFDQHSVSVLFGEQHYRFDKPAELASNAYQTIVSPMSGTISQLFVNIGDTVEKNQPLLDLEAMKMVNTLSAPERTVVKKIHIKPGDIVSNAQLLIELDKA